MHQNPNTSSAKPEQPISPNCGPQAISSEPLATAPGSSPAKSTALSAQAPPATSPRKPKNRKGILLAVLAVVLAVVIAFSSFVVFLVANTITNFFYPTAYNTSPPQDSFSVISVVGTIQSGGNSPYSLSSQSYYHDETLEHINSLIDNENNLGIFLYMNTGGGGVYESDEVYLALMEYKEATGRPVWAYMADTCASGGYYIAAAADHIVANRNTTTGSIGVYIAITDTSRLYEELGIETVLIRSGEHKGTGISGTPVSEDQREVYQGIVDEMYERFVGIVANGRNMTLSEARELSDGRVYTGQQAMELGLVDDIGNYEDTLAAFGEQTEATAFYPNFSRQSPISQLIGTFFSAMPTNEVDAALQLAQQLPSGVPMALYTP